MLIDRDNLQGVVRGIKETRKSIVFTNGCFDVLHVGHVRLLEEASKLGDVLIVGINSDSSVRIIKGETRPFFPDEERAVIIDSLKGVDYVVVFPETTASNLIKEIQPDFYVKGGDYSLQELPECKALEETGASFHLVALQEGHSTTNIAKKIGRQNEGR